MKNKLSVTIFIMLTLIFLFSQPAFGVDVEKCKDCHGKIVPMQPGTLTKDCMVCHDPHAGSPPGNPPDTRVPATVHNIHGNNRVISSKPECKVCHNENPIACKNCHNSHANVGQVEIMSSVINMTDCINCHGQLPQPGGHSDFRSALSDSKHKWMNCGTCHINTNGDMKLHFKDLSVIQINNSINLCKICHSFQYNELKKGTHHGATNETCVDCHNPHTTKLGAMIIVTPTATPTNVSTTVEKTTDWITTEVPILKNTTALIIIIIIIIATISEYVLSKEEQGRNTAYSTIKVNESEDALRTLEIKLRNQNINIINEVLEESNVNVLGMTMTKEEDKGENVYKYVIFVNIEKLKNENVLVDQIATIDNVILATFTDKYEL